MLLIVGGILALGSLLITINIYKTLKNTRYLSWIAYLIESSPIISFLFNLGVSMLLTSLIGAGMIAGAANLLASILFAIYIEIEKEKDKKVKRKVKRKKR